MTRLKVIKKGQRSSKPFSLQEWHESFGEVLIMGLVQPGRDPRREWRGAGVLVRRLDWHFIVIITELCDLPFCGKSRI